MVVSNGIHISLVGLRRLVADAGEVSCAWSLLSTGISRDASFRALSMQDYVLVWQLSNIYGGGAFCLAAPRHALSKGRPKIFNSDQGAQFTARSLGILLPMIDLKRIFHGTNELCTRCLRNAPRIFQPGLKFVFLSVVRTVSREIRSTTSNSTSLSASIEDRG